MCKLTMKFVCLALMALFATNSASAYNPSRYATTSKLATGKWVKITIPESGMYEITYDELTQMDSPIPPMSRCMVAAVTALARCSMARPPMT